MTSTKTLARLAGALYLVVALCGGFSELYVRSTVEVSGDAAATATNVTEHATLMRAGFVTDLVAALCFLLVGLILYTILKPVNPRVALAMLVFNAVSVAVMSVNMLNHVGALLVATEPAAAGLTAASNSGLVAFLLDMHGHGYLIAQIFFGLYLLPLGYLVYRSGFLPRILGVLLMIGYAGSLAELVAIHLSPDFESSLTPILATPSGIAEVALLLWLVIFGIRVGDRSQPLPSPILVEERVRS